MPARNIVYAYPQWHLMSFSLVAKKHIEQLRKYTKVYEWDETTIPDIYTVTPFALIVHPVFGAVWRWIQQTSWIEPNLDAALDTLSGRLRKFEKVVGFEVADSDAVSELAIKLLAPVDEVCVPSEWSRRSFINSGCKKPVHVVPHGLDTEWYNTPPVNPSEIGNQALQMLYRYKLDYNKKLLTFWLWHSPDRKGYPEVQQFYEKLRKERNDVALVIKTQGPLNLDIQSASQLNIVNVWGWLDEREKMLLYDLSDITLLFSRGGAFEINCTPPDTLVITDKGAVPIKDVREGDYVLTHNGRFKRVTKVLKRHYKGKLVVLEPYGLENIAVKLTPEHPVLVLKTSKYKHRKWNLVLKQRPIWVSASEVAKGDAVLIPILNIENADMVYDLAKFIEDDIKLGTVNVTNEHIEYVASGTRRRDTPGRNKIMRITGETKKVVEKAIKYYEEGKEPKSERVKRVIEFLKAVGYEPQKIKIKRFVRLDKHLARVIGYYLAEGSINEGNYAIEFSFGNEPKIASDCADCIEKVFGYTPSIYRYGDRKLIKVVVCNKAIARFLLALCGKGAGSKRLPLDLFKAGKEVLSEAVWAMILGDGCLKSGFIEYVSKSPHLAYFAYLALAVLGYKPTILYHKRLKEYMLRVFLPKELRPIGKAKKPYPNILAPRETDYRLHSNKSYISPDRKYLFALVKEVSEEDYDGEVYNLEVESDNTYTAHMVVVHNCLESLARGVPIIAHRRGAWAEYAPEWCLVPEALKVKVFADNAIHTGYGYTIDVEKAVDLAHAMLDNLDEYKARTKEYAQQVLAEKFTWEKVGALIWDIVSR